MPGAQRFNAGDPSFVGPPDFDQRGDGFARVQLVRIDIGAFETEPLLPSQGLVVSTTSDIVDGDFSVGELSLREAVIIANEVAGADTITFDSNVFSGGAASLIRLSGTELQITESLTIDGSSGTDVVISGDAEGDDTPVDGTFITDVGASEAAGKLDDNSRVINFTASSGDLTVTSLTITGGRLTGEFEDGGGIRFLGDGVVTITSSNIRGNSITRRNADGGGVYASNGRVVLTDSNVSGNSSGGDGGGVFSISGDVLLTSSEVRGNTSARDGGGIFAIFGAVTLTSSIVDGNTSLDDGGGIATSSSMVTLIGSTVSGNNTVARGGGIATSNGAVILTSSTIRGNTSGGNGGGIDTVTGPVLLTSSNLSGNTSGRFGGGVGTTTGPISLTDSTVSGNSSDRLGGGIFANAGAVTLTNTTVSGNTSGEGGGGIYTDDSIVRILNSTISGNAAGGIGGGIGLYADNFNDDERLIVRNSIVALNTDNGTAPDLLAPGDPGNDLTVDFSLIGDTTGSGVTAATGAGNLLNVDPLLGPLADNGGPTLTHALLAGSPALDAGDLHLRRPDQRGLRPTPFDLPLIGNAVVK